MHTRRIKVWIVFNLTIILGNYRVVKCTKALFICIKDTFLLISSSYNDSLIYCIWFYRAYNLVFC
jgi:hypothetical protein